MNEGGEKKGAKDKVINIFTRRPPESVRPKSEPLTKVGDGKKVHQLPRSQEQIKSLAIKRAQRIIDAFKKAGITDAGEPYRSRACEQSGVILRGVLVDDKDPIDTSDIQLLAIALEYINRVSYRGDI